MEEKVLGWINQLKILSKIAVVEPQAANCTFVGGFKHKVTYTIRTVPNTRKHLEKLDQAVDTKFIPTLTDVHFSNETEKEATITSCKTRGNGYFSLF